MKWSYRLIQLLSLSTLHCTTMAVQYEKKPWPQASACQDCSKLQVGFIQFALPTKKIRTINVLHLDGANAHISFQPNYAGTANQLSFAALSKQYAKDSSIIQKARTININTPLNLFKKFSGETTNKTLLKLKQAHAITEAKRYISYHGTQKSAFWIDAIEQNMDALYIIPKGNDQFVYVINGELDEKIVHQLLTHTSLPNKQHLNRN